MSVLDHIEDPHVQAQLKLHAARIDAALASAGDTSDGLAVVAQPTTPAHPDTGTRLWLSTSLPYTLYASLEDENGIREWVDISTPAVGGPGSSVAMNYASVGALPAATSNEGVFARVTTASSSAVYISTKKGGSGASLEWVPIWYFEA